MRCGSGRPPSHCQGIKIVKKDNRNVTSTKNLIWCSGDAQPCQERDGSNNVTKRFFSQGMQVDSTNYYYGRDHLGSIRELTDSSGAVQARYDYDPYGRRTRVTGSVDTDFGFTGFCFCGIHLAMSGAGPVGSSVLGEEMRTEGSTRRMCGAWQTI